MIKRIEFAPAAAAMVLACAAGGAFGAMTATVTDGRTTAVMSARGDGVLRAYELSTDAELREGRPADGRVAFAESPGRAIVRSGNVMFDGLYAMAVDEAAKNSVPQIQDSAYGHGQPIALDAFQTGEFWTYVWTRDLSYSVYLGLAQFDARRAASSLFFKTSALKSGVAGGNQNQIIQDTGSGGSYPVSSDRVVWALGAAATLEYLSGAEREEFLRRAYPVLRGTIEQDRRLVFDEGDGLYRGEESFLDWREQTYPAWTATNVLAIAMSKSLSVNALDFFMLETAARFAREAGLAAEARRYTKWAEQLKRAINEKFFDAKAGLYSACLLSDGVSEIRTRRYELLGESLAILTGIADESASRSVLKNYPIGSHGPPVVWPQERAVAIYHNQAVWPFVTAFWAKAARKAEHPEAVALALRSLCRFAAFNLSNMENFDFRTGKAEVKDGAMRGPVINSRRQLWSVAGFLSVVQDEIFGLETDWDGIRFRPFIPAEVCNEWFSGGGEIALDHFDYRGAKIHVRVHLPRARATSGVCSIERILLNGKNPGGGFVPRGSLRAENEWEVFLAAPAPSAAPAPLRIVDVRDARALFAPPQPVWDEARGGVVLERGRAVLHYAIAGFSNAVFNIYRDGILCAEGVRATSWVDPDSGGAAARLHSYSVEAADPVSGNVSHLSQPRSCADGASVLEIPAAEMKNSGGSLAGGDHFENWGKPDDRLVTKIFTAGEGGRFEIRAEFSNGSGPVNTGIACGVKKLELIEAGSRAVLASGHLVMPQSGDWNRWDVSSPVVVNLVAGGKYLLVLSEDEVSRNMSFFEGNARYTAGPGGGGRPCNFVNVKSLWLRRVETGVGKF